MTGRDFTPVALMAMIGAPWLAAWLAWRFF